MAKATSIEVGVSFTIPDETVKRCLRILEMWMDDNQDKDVVCDLVPYENGYRHEIHIEDASEDNDEAEGEADATLDGADE